MNTKRLATTAVLFASIVAPWMLPSGPFIDLVFAAHPRGPGAHTYTMHSADAFSDEDYCTDDVTSQSVITDAVVASYISDALNNTSPRKWDGVGGGRLDFWPSANPCTLYTHPTFIEVGIRVDHSWSHCGSSSCVEHLITTADGNHFRYTRTYVRVDHIDGTTFTRRATLNHEFGHVVGLCDPVGFGLACDPPTTTWPTCSSGSVIHQFYDGCVAHSDQPRADDQNNVVAQMNTYP